MRKLLFGAAMVGAAYWASKQPGGMQGTWKRLQKGIEEIQKGENPQEVIRRFLSGTEAIREEPQPETRTLATDIG